MSPIWIWIEGQLRRLPAIMCSFRAFLKRFSSRILNARAPGSRVSVLCTCTVVLSLVLRAWRVSRVLCVLCAVICVANRSLPAHRSRRWFRRR